jgi:hypothetical protein
MHEENEPKEYDKQKSPQIPLAIPMHPSKIQEIILGKIKNNNKTKHKILIENPNFSSMPRSCIIFLG